VAIGGGADVGDVADLRNARFAHNSARGGASNAGAGGNAHGGGLRLTGTGQVELVTLRTNEAHGGDGATDGGDAIGGGYLGSIALTNSTLFANAARGGSGAGGSGGSALGGGWYADGSALGEHVTVASNTAHAGSGSTNGQAAGGGLYIAAGQGFFLTNGLLADSTVTQAGSAAVAEDCAWGAGAFDHSWGFNLVEAPGSCVLTFAATDVTGVDPRLGSPVGGSCSSALADSSCVRTISLASASPAIDGGSCAASGATKDQRSFTRPFDAPAADVDDGCDIGAFEWTDLDGTGYDDGVELLADGFESGNASAWPGVVQ
jgi:hypothetical protein